MNQCLHLIRLAEGWRTKAADLKRRHGQSAPNLMAHVEAALEGCAAELEEELRRVPGDKWQVEGSSAPNLKLGT